MKRTLEAAGFVVIKQKGFGLKRNMTAATMTSKAPASLSWLKSRNTTRRSEQAKTAIAIGAGIAG